jgi:hypothetical protein
MFPMDSLPSSGGYRPSQPGRRDVEVREQFNPWQSLPNCHDMWKDPAWRWRRVTYLLEHGRRPFTQLDDDLTWSAWRFRRALNRLSGRIDDEQLVRDFPAYREAYQIYRAGGMRQWEVEARLLGEQDDEEIAARCGLSPAGVESYHAFYFECRPHLHASTYITNVLIGPKAHDGLQPTDHEVLLKLMGYNLGGLAVDGMLDYLLEPPMIPTTLDGLDAVALKKLSDKLLVHTLIMSLTIPADLASLASLNEMRELLNLVEARAGKCPAGVLTPITPALDALESAPDPATDTSTSALYPDETGTSDRAIESMGEDEPARQMNREMTLA